ncbi:MAG: helix-turn-helix transcriptional regulator [Pseudomonadales bacterium]|jgi:ribosome-binding protein aMBF1 (putative translation factor)|nr:helix-turn-helix transcriptional regulator [Pseudomonadales bacterium]
MNSFEKTEYFGRVPQTTSGNNPSVVVRNAQFEAEARSADSIRPGFVSPRDLVKRVGEVVGHDRMAAARRWLSEVYEDEPGSLRALRLRAGLSQAELAKQLGTTQAHVSRIEAGRCDIHFNTARRLKNVLGVDMNTIDRALGPFEDE